jgi:hypothetical protein
MSPSVGCGSIGVVVAFLVRSGFIRVSCLSEVDCTRQRPLRQRQNNPIAGFCGTAGSEIARCR